MSGFQMITEDMKTASNAATEAADLARGHGSSAAMEDAGGALQGSDTARFLPELGSSWDKEITGWADLAHFLGTAIADVSAGYLSTDDLFDSRYGLLRRRVGRS